MEEFTAALRKVQKVKQENPALLTSHARLHFSLCQVQMPLVPLGDPRLFLQLQRAHAAACKVRNAKGE